MFRLEKDDRIMVLGSCFAANVGGRLVDEGYNVCLNPFGTLFNPASIASSILRLESGRPFTEDECIQMGAGNENWGSFSHYTKFARPTREEFLDNANASLENASAFFKASNKIIVTFGTSFVFRHKERGVIVSNCLKRPGYEFERYRMDIDEIVSIWRPLLDGPLAGKDVLFTVSPIRHLADTAHGNQLSKATLLLAIDALGVDYFPAYEIVLDDLRDYSWYKEDRVHPSEEAIDAVWKKFKDYAISR